MTTARKAAAPSKGAAARAETNGKPKSLKWRELTLELPKTLEDLDGDMFFAMAGIEDGNPSEISRLLRSILGEDQFRAVRGQLRGQTSFGEIPQILTELLTDVFKVFGTSPGESSASASS